MTHRLLVLFTCQKPPGVLMFKLLLMRQTLFDFDVLLPRSCVALSLFRFFLEEGAEEVKAS